MTACGHQAESFPPWGPVLGKTLLSPWVSPHLTPAWALEGTIHLEVTVHLEGTVYLEVTVHLQETAHHGGHVCIGGNSTWSSTVHTEVTDQLAELGL